MSATPTNLPLEISVQETKRRLDNADDFLLVDCREPRERALCEIKSSLLIPMQETPQRLAELEPYRDRPIVIHCHGGMRSLQVAQWLRSQGFLQTQSMAGGIDAWSVEIDPTVPRY